MNITIIRKFFIVLLISLGIIILSIIFKNINVEELFARDDRFVSLTGSSVSGSTNIIIDTETKVMYLWHEDYYKGGLTVMLDSEGKPLLWDK